MGRASRKKKNRRSVSKSAGNAPIQPESVPAGGSEPSNSVLKIGIFLGFGAVIAAIYSQVYNFAAIGLDDQLYVFRNPLVLNGLTAKGLVQAFYETVEGFWGPAVWLSFMLEHTLWGSWAGGYHLTNVFLHFFNTLLIFGVFTKLDRGSPSLSLKAFLVAALFAVHPVHVESVAWIVERKDVLFMLFALSSLGCYLWWVEKGGLGRYLLSLTLFAMSLMSKSMAVTLPVLFFILDGYPLKRLDKNNIQKRIIEKVPFLFLGLTAAGMTLLATGQAGILDPGTRIPFSVRCLLVPVFYVKYLASLIWPSSLVFYRPHPGNPPLWQVAGAISVLAGVTFYACKSIRHRPYLLTGWLWFLVTLVPVIGLIATAEQGHQDRFLYLAGPGIYMIFAWAVIDFYHQKAFSGRRIIIAVIIGILTSLTWTAHRQTEFWKNSETLYTRHVKAYPDDWWGYISLASHYKHVGKNEDAIENYRRALKLNPEFPPGIYNDFGVLLAGQGREKQAVRMFETAIEKLGPNRPEPGIIFNLGLALEAEALKTRNPKLLIRALDRFEQSSRLGYPPALDKMKHIEKVYEMLQQRLDNTRSP